MKLAAKSAAAIALLALAAVAGVAVAQDSVEWTSSTEVVMSPASNGSSSSYEVVNKSGIGNFSIELEGKTNTGWDNHSQIAMEDTDSFQYTIGGNTDPIQSEVWLTGNSSPRARAYEKDGDGAVNAESVGVGTNVVCSPFDETGSLACYDADSGAEKWYKSLGSNLVDVSANDNIFSTNGSHTMRFNATGHLIWSAEVGSSNGITVTPDGNSVWVANSSGTATRIDGGTGLIELVTTDLHGTTRHLKSNNNYVFQSSGYSSFPLIDEDTGNEVCSASAPRDSSAIGINSSDYLMTHGSGDVRIHNSSCSTIVNKGVDGTESKIIADMAGKYTIVSTGSKAYVYHNSNMSEVYNVSTSVRGVVFSRNDVPDSFYAIKSAGEDLVKWVPPKEAAVDPAADIDSDGTDEVSYTGTLSDDTKKYDVSISPGSHTLTVTTEQQSTVDVNLKIKERTKTKSPTVEVNGHTTGITGVLDDGETAELTADTAWLQDGTNNVSVLVGDTVDPSIAPDPQVTVRYSHDSVDEVQANVTSHEWLTEANVSRSFNADRDAVELRVPYQSTAYSVESIETRTNGGSWSSMAGSDYELKDGDLAADIGSVSSGDTVELRANTSTIEVHNGSIDIEEPTPPGEPLNTRFSAQNPGSDYYISIGSHTDHTRLHYIEDESWSADPSARITAGGRQHLRLPNVHDGAAARIKREPVEIEPEIGDVDVDVTNSGLPLELDVEQGASQGDPVTYRYLDAETGETYELYSVDKGRVVDTDTAESPAELQGSDTAGVFKIRLESDYCPFCGSSSSGSGSGGGDGAGIPKGDTVVRYGVGALVTMLVMFLVFRRFGDDGETGEGILDRLAENTTWMVLAVVVVAVSGALIRRATEELSQQSFTASWIPVIIAGLVLLVVYGKRRRGGT